MTTQKKSCLSRDELSQGIVILTFLFYLGIGVARHYQFGHEFTHSEFVKYFLYLNAFLFIKEIFDFTTNLISGYFTGKIQKFWKAFWKAVFPDLAFWGSLLGIVFFFILVILIAQYVGFTPDVNDISSGSLLNIINKLLAFDIPLMALGLVILLNSVGIKPILQSTLDRMESYSTNTEQQASAEQQA